MANSQKKQHGITLMAVLVAVGILVICFLAILNLMADTIKYGTQEEQKIVALGLAQEGLELVRNVRDNNIMKSDDYDYGLAVGDKYCIDYSDGLLQSDCANNLLKINNDGFYEYDLGTDTIYKRKIEIEEPADYITVTCTVFWQRGTHNYDVKLENRLYDWRN